MRRAAAVAIMVAAPLLGCKRAPSPTAARTGASPKTSPSIRDAGPNGPVDGTTALPYPLPDVAARVNDEPIPIAFVDNLAQEKLKGLGGFDMVRQRPLAFRSALKELIIRELLVEEAIARHISASDKDVEQAYNMAHLQKPKEEEWAVFLANKGFTRDGLRASMRAQLTANALIEQEERSGATDVSDADALAFYQANSSQFESGEALRLADIFLKVRPGESAVQKAAITARAEALLARAKKGEDFTLLAKQSSEDPKSAAEGGVFPNVHRGSHYDPAFEKAAFALNPGEISGVVQTGDGLHIIKLLSKSPSSPLPFEVIKDRIKSGLMASRGQKRVADLVDRLWAKAKIETYI